MWSESKVPSYEAEGSEHGVNSKDHLEVTAGGNSSTSSVVATTLFAREEAVGIDEHDVRSPDPGLGDVENFQVILHGSITDLPDGLRRRYYELCCAQKAVLHRNLLETNHMLVEGVIMETSDIAECVMAPLHAAAATSSREVLLVWKKTLGALEGLGMDVAFLRRRVDDLLGIHAARASTVRVYSRCRWGL
ncbi:B3 domain-containing protein Os01g0234100-like isoform X1 [Triticum dicoccoides]|nr:B3 domain-containing protein Os01g0234100-like isoform X1 [Triticum dicoccoides]